jgi:hypothetical protein
VLDRELDVPSLTQLWRGGGDAFRLGE